MSEQAAVTPNERTAYSALDRERSVRLSQLVALAFSGFLIFCLLWMGAVYMLHPREAIPAFAALAAALAGCVLLYGLALWLARRRQVLRAATTVIASTLLAIVASQIAWESASGLSALVVASCGMYIIAIALSGVLGNARLMFGTAAVTSALSAVVCLALPARMGAMPPDAVLAWITAAGEQWLAAVLTFGASSLYEQALHDVGALRVAMERARQLDELKDQFITNVNHELRTPIMALHGYIKLLKLRHTGVSDERRAELIEKAERAGDRVVALLTSILDVRRIDEQTEELAPEVVNVRASVEAAAGLIDPLEVTRSGAVIERELRVHIASGLVLWAEPVRVQQIFTNLLSNAIKYSSPGTAVEIAARIVESAPPELPADAQVLVPFVEITVRDYGLGIPPHQLPLLFHRFVRLPRDLASTVPGNGLGLHLCRTLASAMGGTVWAESSGVAGEGTTLHVCLPPPPAETMLAGTAVNGARAEEPA
ncbi:MAG: sensor histidine kinase [Ktedonobacterales bacterium]